MAFRKATKKQAKLRCAIFGPSGSGKTMSALRIATGLGGSIAVIDSEYGRSELYSDRYQFDISLLDTKRSIDEVIEALNEAAEVGYEIVIIDSLSHAWQELLEEVDKLAMTKYQGNTWSAWSEGTPKQKRLIRALIQFPGHLIATMRSKTEWKTQDTKGGKSKPVKIGLAPEQGKGIEYEFDMLMELTVEHMATVTKDRTGRFQDKILEYPGEDFGRELVEWLSSGEEAAAPRTGKQIVNEIVEVYRDEVFTDAERKGLRKRLAGIKQLDDLEQFLAEARKTAEDRRRKHAQAERAENSGESPETADAAEPDETPQTESEPEQGEPAQENANASGDDLDIF